MAHSRAVRESDLLSEDLSCADAGSLCAPTGAEAVAEV